MIFNIPLFQRTFVTKTGVRTMQLSWGIGGEGLKVD